MSVTPTLTEAAGPSATACGSVALGRDRTAVDACAVEQFVVYREVQAEVDPQRELFLAVPESVRAEVFESGVARMILAKQIKRLVSFDPV